jgi:hypothetical protein
MKSKVEPRRSEKYPNVIIPTKATLKKYGLTEEAWAEILDRQNGVCFICGKVPDNNRLAIDHFHTKGFKKLPPTCKPMWVRGLLCNFDNHYTLARSITVEKAKKILEYLENFDKKLKDSQARSMPKNLLTPGSN